MLCTLAAIMARRKVSPRKLFGGVVRAQFHLQAVCAALRICELRGGTAKCSLLCCATSAIRVGQSRALHARPATCLAARRRKLQQS